MYITTGDNITPSATVTLKDLDGNSYTDAAVGVGSVDAVFKAVERITSACPPPPLPPFPPPFRRGVG